MRILYITSLYTPNLVGGAERVVQSLAEGVVRAGHKAIVVCSAPQQGTRISWINGVKVYYVGLKNVYWPYQGDKYPGLLKPLWHGLDTYNLSMARELARILDAEHPDLVHTHTLAGFSTLVWQPIKHRNLPLVHTLHDYYLLCPKATMFRNGKNCRGQCVQCRMYALLRIRHSARVNTVVGVSKSILERHLAFGCFAATPKRTVVYNAYKAESAMPSSAARSLPIRFGFLGQLDPTKGIEVLLESVTRLPEGTWRLNIGGRGLASYQEHLRAKYRTPAVKFLGYVKPDVFFSDIDVLVVPSIWHEPSPRVVSEAYAHGVPVIGSSRGGIPELVERGRTGFTYDPTRANDLVMTMRRYIDQPSLISSMRSACWQRARAFSPETAVEQHLEVYHDA